MSNALATRRPRGPVLLALCGVLGVAVGACADPVPVSGANPAKGEPPVVQAVPEVVAEVPKALQDKGHIVFATNAPYPPLEFFSEDNKTLTGFDIDLGNAIGAAMGLEVRWENISFDSIVPGLQAGKYDVGMAGFSIEHERLSTVDFVSYYLSGGGFLIKKGSGIEVGSFADLCGYRVAVQKGVSQVEALQDASDACTAASEDAINILQIPDQNVVTLTLQSGRADVVVGDKPQVSYAAGQSNGTMCVISTYQTGHSIAGIAVPKGNDQLRTALRDSINSLIDSGDYTAIGEIWDVGTPQQGATLSAEYEKVSAPWGVGRDGTVVESKIFTDPNGIQPGHTYYYQPIVKGCA